MMKLARMIRLALSLAVLAVGGVLLLHPGLLSAREWEYPCQFGGPPGSGWECTPHLAHIYGGECEGIDCYYMMETCCAFPE
jgi:hypothetical protein